MPFEVGKIAKIGLREGEVVHVSEDETRVCLRMPGGQILDVPSGEGPVRKPVGAAKVDADEAEAAGKPAPTPPAPAVTPTPTPPARPQVSPPAPPAPSRPTE